jgi:hypothetical protein
MNIWALEKDEPLKLLLLILKDRFGAEAFALTEQGTADYRAVSLRGPGPAEIRAYVFTHGQTAGKYGLHLEYPEHPENPAAPVSTARENLALPELMDLLHAHLDFGHAS